MVVPHATDAGVYDAYDDSGVPTRVAPGWLDEAWKIDGGGERLGVRVGTIDLSWGEAGWIHFSKKR